MKAKRQIFSSGAPWENIVGYSRAVRVGNRLEISGTVASENGQPRGLGSYSEQTRCILENISAVLAEAGFSLQDVVRTRIFICDIRYWEEVGKVHGEFFNTIRPTTSMVEVSRLIHPGYLVEIEAMAIKVED